MGERDWGRLPTQRGKWVFVAKQQGGAILAEPTQRVLAEAPGPPDVSRAKDKEPEQVWRVSRYRGWGFWLNWFSGSFLKLAVRGGAWKWASGGLGRLSGVWQGESLEEQDRGPQVSLPAVLGGGKPISFSSRECARQFSGAGGHPALPDPPFPGSQAFLLRVACLPPSETPCLLVHQATAAPP